jgi:hypothetical protein
MKSVICEPGSMVSTKSSAGGGAVILAAMASVVESSLILTDK